MRLLTALAGTSLLALAPSALAAEPCSPRTMLPYHVSAFASGASAGDRSALDSSLQAGPARGELELQAECLAWELSLTPKAELLGVFPVTSPAPSGVRTPMGTVSRVFIPRSGNGRSGPSPLGAPDGGPSLLQPVPGAFTLGATLLPVP